MSGVRGRTSSIEVDIKGKTVRVQGASIDGQKVIVLGRFLKRASVYGEDWSEGMVVTDPEGFLRRLRQYHLKADLFTFAQKVPDSHPRFRYHLEWDNVAAIPLTSYEDWWTNRLPHESRKNVKRAAKRGVIVERVDLSEDLIRGITDIYNESPVRQGKAFYYYGKRLEEMRNELSALRERSDFIGAFCEGELIGFIKLVYMGETAGILHLLAKNSHYDKRPTNALIAKAVELCSGKGLRFLVYGRYFYGNKRDSTLVEFKRRNGFEKINVPRYYIPLTLKGRAAIALGLHVGLVARLPASVLSRLVRLRAWAYDLAGRCGLLTERKEGESEWKGDAGESNSSLKPEEASAASRAGDIDISESEPAKT